MQYEVQIDGMISTVNANSHGDAISKVLSSRSKPKAVLVCEVIEGAIKEYKPAIAIVRESVQVDWLLQKDGSWDSEKTIQFIRLMPQREPFTGDGSLPRKAWWSGGSSAGEVTEAAPTACTVLEQWKPEQGSIGSCRGTAVASVGALLGMPTATARAVSDTPPNSVVMNYDPIADKASPTYYIRDGHAYRLATEKDVEAWVWVSDTSFEFAITEDTERLVGFHLESDEPFTTIGEGAGRDEECTWRYAYVQDDSLLQGELVNRSMAVSMIGEDDKPIGPPPVSREEIDQLNAEYEQAVQLALEAKLCDDNESAKRQLSAAEQAMIEAEAYYARCPWHTPYGRILLPPVVELQRGDCVCDPRNKWQEVSEELLKLSGVICEMPLEIWAARDAMECLHTGIEGLLSDRQHAEIGEYLYHRFMQTVPHQHAMVQEGSIQKGDAVLMLYQNALNWVPAYESNVGAPIKHYRCGMLLVARNKGLLEKPS